MKLGAPQHRKVTRVAVGVLLREGGRVLLADRPTGKPYAGYWEFPGGKIEPGEPVAVALERELHEELGIEIGPSKPWVTFEFDYPHAYVELQFRLVDRWRGAPHAREGQRLRFVDPAGELPQPLLPAAVPALRWLRLPRTALVTTPQQTAAILSADASDAAKTDREPTIIVVDGDWIELDLNSFPWRLPRTAQGERRWLMVGGPGARRAPGWDGAVFETHELPGAGQAVGGWRGAWVDSENDLRLAASSHCDYVLVRSAAAIAALRRCQVALPAFVPATLPIDVDETCCHGRWIDLRSIVPTTITSLPG